MIKISKYEKEARRRAKEVTKERVKKEAEGKAQKIWSIDREIRFLKLRKMFPDEFKNSEPMTNDVITELIKILEQRKLDIEYRN
jgi:hypothetical protein